MKLKNLARDYWRRIETGVNRSISAKLNRCKNTETVMGIVGNAPCADHTLYGMIMQGGSGVDFPCVDSIRDAIDWLRFQAKLRADLGNEPSSGESSMSDSTASDSLFEKREGVNTWARISDDEDNTINPRSEDEQ